MSLADSTEIAVEQSLPLEAVIRKRCDVIAVLLPDSPVSATAPQGQPGYPSHGREDSSFSKGLRGFSGVCMLELRLGERFDGQKV